MLHVTYLIILLPLVGFAVQVVAGRRLGDPAAGVVATSFVGASFVVAVGVYLDLLGRGCPGADLHPEPVDVDPGRAACRSTPASTSTRCR